MSDAVSAVVFLLVIVAVYFLPTVVAVQRGHHQAAAIAIVNIFLGWTFLGWVVALVWSASWVRTAHH